MGAYLSGLLSQVWTLTARGMTTQIGVQAWAQRLSDLVGSLSLYIALSLQRRWRRMLYQEFFLSGEDALTVLRWVKEQPAAQIASSFSVQKDIAVQLRNDAPCLEDVSELEQSLEFKPNLEAGILRLSVGGTYVWFHTSQRQKLRLQRSVRRQPMPTSSSSSANSSRKKRKLGSNAEGDPTVSAVAGFDGLSAVAAAEVAREEQARESAFVSVTVMNTPWQQSSAKSILARMLQEGKQLQRKDDTRFATYKIGIDTDSCAFLMRWIRSQPKALQPTQMRVSDGDGIRELTPEEQNKMHNGGLGEENEEDNDEPTFLLQSADERAFRLVFNWNGEAVPMWITAERGVGYVLRTTATDQEFIKALLLEGHRLLQQDVPPYMTFRFQPSSREADFVNRWIQYELERQDDSLASDVTVQRRRGVVATRGSDNNEPEFQFLANAQGHLKFKFEGVTVWVCGDETAASSSAKPTTRPAKRRSGEAALATSLAPVVLGSSQVVLKIRGKKEAQAVVNRILRRGHRLRKEDAKREIQIYVTDRKTPIGHDMHDSMDSGRKRSKRGGGNSSGWLWKSYSEGDPPRHISTIILPRLPDGSDMAKYVLEDARSFLKEKQQYYDLGIKWKRTYLLEGVPGTGKTSLASAVAGELQLPMYFMNVNQHGMDEKALLSLCLAAATPSVLLIEEIDELMGDNPKCDLSIEQFLQVLDGVVSVKGKLMFITTNHKERIEAKGGARMIRGGRIDEVLHFSYADKEQIYRKFLTFKHCRQQPVARLLSPILTPGAALEASLQTPGTCTPLGLHVGLNNGSSARAGGTLLEKTELEHLANRFSELVPEKKTTLSNVQAFIQKHRKNLHGAVTTLEELDAAAGGGEAGEQARWSAIMSPAEQREWAAYHRRIQDEQEATYGVVAAARSSTRPVGGTDAHCAAESSDRESSSSAAGPSPVGSDPMDLHNMDAEHEAETPNGVYDNATITRELNILQQAPPAEHEQIAPSLSRQVTVKRHRSRKPMRQPKSPQAHDADDDDDEDDEED